MKLIATTCLAGLLSLSTFTMVDAQEGHFDHTDPKECIISSTVHHGRQAYKNAYGEILEANRVYDMPLEEQIEMGYTHRASKAGTGALKTDGAESGTVFNVTFLDVVNDNDKGFDDPELGETRRNTLLKAFAYYSGLIENEGVVDIEIQESFSANFQPFAVSAPYFFSSYGFNDGLVVKHLTSGFDPAGGIADGFIKFNFIYNYNYNINATPASNQYDFYTVALHEILHVLGFTSFCGPTGNSQSGTANVYTSFDKFLMVQEGQPFFETSGQGAETVIAPYNPDYVQNNQMLFKANEGLLAPIYSPGSYSGSSIDHFDNARSSSGDYVMHPSLSKGVKLHELHYDEAYTLSQLGYSVNLSLATSIEEESMLDVTASIFPNPATKNSGVSINLEGLQGNKEILVVVYDMMGKKAYSKVLVTEGDGVFTAIDPYHNLAPGMYIVIGSANDELFNQKLMILGKEGNSNQPFLTNR